jgi:hypothetical protein
MIFEGLNDRGIRDEPGWEVAWAITEANQMRARSHIAYAYEIVSVFGGDQREEW